MKIYFPKVKYYIINDKFKLIFINTESNIFSACITIDVGSINEQPNELGLAHFFEHMIFKGTINKTSDEILNQLDSIGAQYNASTSYDETKYYISGNKKDYKIILDILLDLFLNPIFPNKDIANEINVVLEEFRMNEDNKSKQTFIKLMELIYKDTDPKYSIPVIGLPNNIINFTRDNLIKFYKSNYLKGNKILSIIGSANEKEIINLICKNCNLDVKSIKPWNPEFNNLNSKLEIEYYKNNINKKLEIINTPKLNQFIVTIAFRSINMYSKWSLVSELLEIILAGGMTSRLFILLRNKLGLTYYQSAFGKYFTSHGFFCINYGVQPEGLYKSLDSVLKEILFFKNIEITLDELDKSKNMLETSLLFNTETTTDIGSHIIDSVINKLDPKYIKEIHTKLNKITPKYITQFATKIFKKSNMFIVINGDEKINLDKINNIINTN